MKVDSEVDRKRTLSTLSTFLSTLSNRLLLPILPCTVKLGNKERFDKEQIGIKEPFPVTNLPFTS